MSKFLRLMLLLILLLVTAGVMPAASQEDPGDQPDPYANANNTFLYLPLTLSGFASLGVSGQVTDENGQPLSEVVISNGDGLTTTTDINGQYGMLVDAGASGYAFSPEKGGMGFAPSVVDLDVDDYVSNLDFTGLSSCGEMVVNGGFETAEAWQLENALYSTAVFNDGARSLLLGLSSEGGSASGESSAQTPVLSIPAEAKDPILRLWVYTRSVSAAATEPSVAAQDENFFGPSTDANDLQAVYVLDANGNPLETLWEAHGANTQLWGLMQFNLYKYSGLNIRLGFRVVNDGAGSATALYVDDVSLQTCPTLYAPEGYSSETYAPQAPAACVNQVVNSGFEAGSGWGIPYTSFSAGYVDRVPYPEEVYLGNRAMRTGIPVYQSYLNRYSYSDSWQTVYIPGGATSATLSLYNKMANPAMPLSSDQDVEVNLAETEPQYAPGAIWGEQPLWGDQMYILILNPYTGAILRTLQAWDARSNNWKLREYDLTPFRGRYIRIQFGTYNDGWDGVQSMYVDELYLEVCDGAIPPPPPPALTCPTGYTERLFNNSFETSNGWYIPITVYSARYTNLFWHSGARSMQTGIYNYWHNRYSYSDFGQAVYIPSFVSAAILKFWVYRQSSDIGYDKQYLLVLNNWGYWIDTLLWNSSNNNSSWEVITKDVRRLGGSWPIRLQWGTYNNGWGGITSMFVDDVTLCTVP